jgi:ABC-2 type transport system permease protein
MSAPTVDPAPAPAGASKVEAPHPSTLTQWWVLTTRFIAPTLRNGELITAIGASVAFTVALYIPFSIPWTHYVGGASKGVSANLGQYITPLITLQAVAFAAISSAFRAATDSLEGVNRRFRSMPIAPLTPVLARVSASVYRCCIGLTVSLICGHAIGFRFYHGALHIAGFCVLVIVIGTLMSFGADLIGTGTRNPDAMLPLLTAPILILGLLSVGVQPLKMFPLWIQPFVRNQPISQSTVALRALAGDTPKAAISVTWPVMVPTLAGLFGFMVVLVIASIIVLSRRP